MSSKKGSQFEREIPILLSLWWSHGNRDDIFWRRDSGARAKYRSRAGKHTFGAHGDIIAADPIGVPLTNLLTIELKRGYGKWSFLDVLDRPRLKKGQKNITRQNYEKFMMQVCEDCSVANTYPALIAKRDMRQAIISIPTTLFSDIKKNCGMYPHFYIETYINDVIPHKMTTILLDHFLLWCTPEYIQQKVQENEEKKNKNKKKRTK